MRYTLKDYQADAVADVLDNITKAKALRDQFGDRSQFSLSATTGAGKTVMAAAVIEALFFGSDEFDFSPDPGAVVLWFSDDPALNEQSRTRIQAAGSDELSPRLIVIPSTFSETELRAGYVYFLNTQKLSRTSRLVRGDMNGNGNGDGSQGELFKPRADDVQQTIYDTIRNTIEDESLTLYFVLDEAHRGMNTSAGERTTIVQRLISGHGDIPAMPIVWGISATVERFQKTMSGVQHRTALPPVAVDSELVQASGLLKDDIVLSIPAESGVFDTTLLKLAVKKTKASSNAWTAYAQSQQEEPDPVVPLLVIAVPDKADNALLTRAVDAVLEEWADLPNDAFANVFGEHRDLEVSGRSIPYISPERVQDAAFVRILFAKSAISTGWDCPRAEVLMSFRPAEDPTHITQLLGRMIRTPLARRIPGNDILNSVECVVPSFDRKTATQVAALLMKGATSNDEEAETGAGGGKGRRVLFDPVELHPNPAVPPAIWDMFESIPSETIPKRGAKPIKRLTALAHALATDELIKDAGKQAHAHLHAALDGRAVQYKGQVAEAVEGVRTMEGEELRAKLHGTTGIIYKAFSETADNRAIQDSYRAAGRILSADLARTYVDYLVGKDGGDDDLRDATVKIAALVLLPQLVKDVEAEADKLAQQWLNETRVARKLKSDERQAVYDDLEATSSTPQSINLIKPTVRLENSKERDSDGNESPLPTRTKHLLSAEDGTCPIDMNDLERAVLDQEMEQPGAVAWYRNPSRATKESLAIAYKDTSAGPYKAVRPDFVFFAQKHDAAIAANIIDPHGHWLGDALPKLKGLANFAEKYGESYGRIEAVSKIGDKLRVLDITKPSVRQTIRDAEDAKSVYESTAATDYK